MPPQLGAFVNSIIVIVMSLTKWISCCVLLPSWYLWMIRPRMRSTHGIISNHSFIFYQTIILARNGKYNGLKSSSFLKIIKNFASKDICTRKFKKLTMTIINYWQESLSTFYIFFLLINEMIKIIKELMQVNELGLKPVTTESSKFGIFLFFEIEFVDIYHLYIFLGNWHHLLLLRKY